MEDLSPEKDIQFYNSFSDIETEKAKIFFEGLVGLSGICLIGCVAEPEYSKKEYYKLNPLKLFLNANEQLIDALYENRKCIIDEKTRAAKQTLNKFIEAFKGKTSKKAALKLKGAAEAYQAIEAIEKQLLTQLDEGEKRAFDYLALMRKAARKTARATLTPNPTEALSTTPRSLDPKADDDSTRVGREISSSFFIDTPPDSLSPEAKEKTGSSPPLLTRRGDTQTSQPNNNTLKRLRAELAARQAAARRAETQSPPTSSHGL